MSVTPRVEQFVICRCNSNEYLLVNWIQHFIEKHLKKNTENGFLECTGCNEKHASVKESMIHLLQMHTSGYYKCMDCELTYFWLTEAREHTSCFCSQCGTLECGCMTQEEIDEYWELRDALRDPDY